MNHTSAMILWGVLTLVFLAVEAMTPQLLCIWFATGSLVSLFAAALRAPFWLQIVLWTVVSAAMVIAMRPLSKKFKVLGEEKLNANRILGRHAIVTEAIVPEAGIGQVKVDGAIWSAKSATEESIPVDSRVKIVRIEGVRAVVRLSRVQPGEDAAKSE